MQVRSALRNNLNSRLRQSCACIPVPSLKPFAPPGSSLSFIHLLVLLDPRAESLSVLPPNSHHHGSAKGHAVPLGGDEHGAALRVERDWSGGCDCARRAWAVPVSRCTYIYPHYSSSPVDDDDADDDDDEGRHFIVEAMLTSVSFLFCETAQ